ncbi:MAG: hypothetical protein ACJ71N_08135 [Terriglobales bacterium]
MSTTDDIRVQRHVSVKAAAQVLRVFWPNFVELDDCVYLDFQCSGGVNELSDGKTETESFINHTHIFDEFKNRATNTQREHVSEDMDVIEETYDVAHADFVAACEIGREMAFMWAIKLKSDFPNERFRVYYTQYDNPIVRFHKVRAGEPDWLSDGQLKSATDPSFGSALIYDTDYLDKPVTKNEIRPQ